MVCKATHCLLRLINKGGTALPGVLALKICPDILKWASEKVKTIAVTGTNGKTTSSRIIEKALRNAGQSVMANRSGANLKSGITSQFVDNLNLFGKPKCKWAVIECDEAACAEVIPAIRPQVLLVTNLFRDQLDRYGTVTKPRDCIVRGLNGSPETALCVNSDCPMAASIAEITKSGVIYFGCDTGKKIMVESGEDALCPMCGGKLHFSGITYANLGKYRCEKCGFSRQNTTFSVAEIMKDNGVLFKIGNKAEMGNPALPGLYNVYNSLGALAAVCSAGFDAHSALDAISDFGCGFGRMERFEIGENTAKMILIKNAAAADQTLEYLKTVRENIIIAFIINNRIADGTDISWIDDAEFARLKTMRGLKKIYVLGDMAEAMRKRLERDNIPSEVLTGYDSLLKIIKHEKNKIFLLPTYTAMLELRQKLVKEFGGKNFWE